MKEFSSMTDPHNSEKLSRRGLLGGAIGAAALATLSQKSARADDDPNWKIMNGRINQSLCSWNFRPYTIEDLCKIAVQLGCKSVELLQADSYPILKKYGLTCAMTSTHGFNKGFNRTENHAMCLDKLTKGINAAADFGSPNV